MRQLAEAKRGGRTWASWDELTLEQKALRLKSQSVLRRTSPRNKHSCLLCRRPPQEGEMIYRSTRESRRLGHAEQTQVCEGVDRIVARSSAVANGERLKAETKPEIKAVGPPVPILAPVTRRATDLPDYKRLQQENETLKLKVERLEGWKEGVAWAKQNA